MKKYFHCIILLILTFCTTIDTAKAQKITPVAKATEPVVTKNSSDEELTLALVVGVSKYRNSRLNLRYAHKDAIDFADFLQSKEGGSIPKGNIMLLTDSTATSSQIYGHLEKLLIRVKKEVKAKKLRIVLFFSMHGGALKDSVGKVEDGYLLTYDTDERFPKQSSVQFSRLHAFEQEFLKRENTRVEVYIDACRAGLNVGLNFDKLPVTELLRNWDNVLRIVSCSPHESSFEREKGENGIFTYYLIKGLSGFADTEEDGVKDGKINAIELLTYLKKNIKEELGKEKKQTPRIWGNDDEQSLAVLHKDRKQLTLTHKKIFVSSNQILLQNKTFSKRNISDLDSIIAINFYLKGAVLYDSLSYIEALECFRKAIAVKRDFAEAYYFSGVILNDLIRYEDALEAYNMAIVLQPDYTDAYNYKGNVLSDLKRYYEALQAYDKAIALKPDYANAYNNKGIVLYYLARKEEALQAYDKAIALKPDDADAYYNKGDVLSALNRKPEALQAYDKAIALKPDNADAYYNKGVVLYYLARKEEALQAYDKAIALKPDYADAYNNKGIVLDDLARKEEALQAYDKAIALKPDYANAYNNKGIVLSDLKRYYEALQAYDKAIALKPDYAEVYLNKGIVLYYLARKEEALQAYDKAIALKPDYADAYYSKGIVLYYLARKEEALQAYDKAIALKPDNADAYNNKGNVLSDLKRYKEALQAYDKAIALKPDYADAYNNKGIVLDDLARKEEALQAYDKAIALKPDFVEAYLNKGKILILSEYYNQAFETFVTYLTLVPNDAKVIKLCAQLAYYNKQPLTSIKYWNQYLQLQPTDIDAWSAIASLYLSEKDYNHAKESFEKSIALNPQQQNPYYNLSCIHSLQNQSKEALAYLEQALQKGYNDFVHIKEDTDLDNIRALPEFSELIKKYQK